MLWNERNVDRTKFRRKTQIKNGSMNTYVKMKLHCTIVICTTNNLRPTSTKIKHQRIADKTHMNGDGGPDILQKNLVAGKTN